MQDDMTRCVNRDGPIEVAEETERKRLVIIRDAVRPLLTREAGGLRGRADRPNLTQLVQEVWLKLERTQRWESRGHFLAAASRAARQVLVDEARKRSRQVKTVPVDSAQPAGAVADPAFPDRLHDLLSELDEADPAAARIAGFRLFGGLPIAVIAEVEGISVRQVHRHWQFARAWLADRLQAVKG